MKMSATPLLGGGTAVSRSDQKGGWRPTRWAGGKEKNRLYRRKHTLAEGRHGRCAERQCFKGQPGNRTGGSTDWAGRACKDAVFVTCMLRIRAALLGQGLAADGLREIALQRRSRRNTQRRQQGKQRREQHCNGQCTCNCTPSCAQCVKPSPAHGTLKDAVMLHVEVAKGRIAFTHLTSTASAAIT